LGTFARLPFVRESLNLAWSIHKPPRAPRPLSSFYNNYQTIFAKNFISIIKVVIDAIFMFFFSLRTFASLAVNNSS